MADASWMEEEGPVVARWTRLRREPGEPWGLRIPGKPSPGDDVIVEKKSGDTEAARVGRVLATFPDKDTGEEISLCTVAEDG